MPVVTALTQLSEVDGRLPGRWPASFAGAVRMPT